MQPNAICHNPALQPMQMANMIRARTTIYVEGACAVDDTGNRSAGSGMWYTQGDERNVSLKHPTDLASNKLGELLAVLWAINNEPPQNDLRIKTRSTYTVNTVLELTKQWEKTGYIGAKNKEVTRAIVAALRGRGGPMAGRQK